MRRMFHWPRGRVGPVEESGVRQRMAVGACLLWFIVGVALFQVLTKKDLPLLHRHLRPVPHPDASSEPMPHGHVDQG